MISALELLGKYSATFRRMINSKVWGSDETIKQLLKLNKNEDWDFLTAAMDIVDDASSAIGNVQRFGLSGPTKYDETGEKYLRLYGLLSATYIQQQSILTIYRIMNVPDPKKLKEKFDALKIRELRHKLSSHSTDYINLEANVMEAYVPLRLDLRDNEVTAVQYSYPVNHDKINILDAIESHTRLMIDTMDEVIEKSIGTIFKGHDKKQAEFSEQLSDLRIEKHGGFVLGSGTGSKIVDTFVESKPRAT